MNLRRRRFFDEAGERRCAALRHRQKAARRFMSPGMRLTFDHLHRFLLMIIAASSGFAILGDGL